MSPSLKTSHQNRFHRRERDRPPPGHAGPVHSVPRFPALGTSCGFPHSGLAFTLVLPGSRSRDQTLGVFPFRQQLMCWNKDDVSRASSFPCGVIRWFGRGPPASSSAPKPICPPVLTEQGGPPGSVSKTLYFEGIRASEGRIQN